MIRTRVGYTGGTLANPTYQNLGDHTESVEVDYDPARIIYADLLDVFWQSHNPTAAAYSRQYMAAVFYHDQEQERLALESRDRLAAGLSQTIATQVLPATTFYLAEDYHQKWNLRSQPLLYNDLLAIYPQPQDLINSTAAARLNGYLGGFGAAGQLQQEIDSLGLSPTARAALLKRFGLPD